MNEESGQDLKPGQARRGNALLAIVTGGLIAGTIDLLQAGILFGWTIPLAIAGGVRGAAAFNGGVGNYILGVCLHFFNALTFAAFYYAVSRRLRFMVEHPLVCGLVYGAAADMVMTLIVLPLSALHARGPYRLQDLLVGISVHMVVIGLPISYSVWRFSR